MRGELVSGFVNTLDLFPTILGLAGVSAPDYAQGYDLISWLASGAKTPLRDCVFAQVGDYHGFCKTTYPSGMPESGRHPGLLQGARNREFSYIHDPDYGDEAYDLCNDPFELRNLLKGNGESVPPEVALLRQRVEEHERECLRLRDELGVVPGDRGFVEGWE
jgi:arylsulfatase A-like enzyme